MLILVPSSYRAPLLGSISTSWDEQPECMELALKGLPAMRENYRGRLMGKGDPSPAPPRNPNKQSFYSYDVDLE